MANLSDAEGTIVIKTDNENVLRKIYDKFREFENKEYNTDLLFKEFLRGKYYKRDDKLPYQFESSFIGTGRWAYTNNIQWAPKELASVVKSFEPFEIKYNFIDRDRAADLHYSAEIVITHIKNTFVEYSTITEVSYVDLSRR